MTSNDIRIVINGQQFVVDGQSLKPAPENNFQQEVMKRFDRLEARVEKVEQQTSAIMIEQAEQRGALNYIHSSLSVWGSIICGIIAFVGIFAPKFWEFFSRKDKPAPEIDIDDVADKVIAIISSRYELKPKN